MVGFAADLSPILGCLDAWDGGSSDMEAKTFRTIPGALEASVKVGGNEVEVRTATEVPHPLTFLLIHSCFNS